LTINLAKLAIAHDPWRIIASPTGPELFTFFKILSRSGWKKRPFNCLTRFFYGKDHRSGAQ
jgi:hypothetical protein